MPDEDGETPGRIAAGPLRTWVALDADRRLLAGLLAVVLYLGIVATVALWPTPFRTLLSTYAGVPYLFQALTTGVFTVVTFVVTVDQLVLSQELGAVGDQRERMQESLAFRRDVGDRIDEPVSPPTPAAFLRALVEACSDSAERVSAVVADEPDDELRGRIDDYVDRVVGNADGVAARLEDAQFGTFGVVSAALYFNYSPKVYEGRLLREEGGDRLDDATVEALDELVVLLEMFGPAREHFKTLYFQWELTNLSRGMISSGVPAVAAAVTGLLLLGDPTQLPGQTLGVEHLTWVVVAAAVASTVPFLLLLSHMLRIAVVAKRTLAMGPFVLQEGERIGDGTE